MKLDSEQKVLLCQKALYAKQLEAYANLCKVYKTLAKEIKKEAYPGASQKSLSEYVERYYGSFLAQASQNDFSFMTEPGAPVFNEREQAAFKAFAEYSLKLNYFKKASEYLFDATHSTNKDGHQYFSIDEKKMGIFNTFLNPPREDLTEEKNAFWDKTGRSFSKMIEENPKRWIGHTYYRIARNSLQQIDEIDSNHISSLNPKTLSPKSFGATITGARGTISVQERFSSKKQELKTDFQRSYTADEHSKLKKPVSPLEDLGATIYKAGHKANENIKTTYKAHKGTLKKALIQASKIGVALAIAALIALATKAGIDAHTFNQLSNDDIYASQGYHTVVSQDTIDRLDSLLIELENTENDSAIPTTQKLYEHRDNIDDALDLVVEDLVRYSFQEKYPNLSVTDVETHYDKSSVNEADGKDGNFIYITCKDKYGKEYKYTLTDFRSQGANRIDTYFDDQYALDYEIGDEIANTATGPYKSRTEATGSVLQKLQEFVRNSIVLARSDAEINIPQAEYDNAKVVNGETIWQKIKSNFDGHFKLVIPEKDKTVENTTPIVDSTERDDR